MKTRIPFWTIIASILLFTACSKTPGCMDLSADNFSNEAEEDDGSCTYSGQAYFYYLYTTQNNFEDEGITDLELYIDDTFIGLQSTDVAVVHFSCNGSSNVTKTFDMGSSKSQHKLLVVKDQSDGAILFTKEIEILANQCIGVEMKY